MTTSIRKVNIVLLKDSMNNDNQAAFKFLCSKLNQLQDYFEVQLFHTDPLDLQLKSSSIYTQSQLSEIYSGKYIELREKNFFKEEIEAKYIYIIPNQIQGDFFYFYHQAVSFITTKDWAKNYSPTSIFKYLLNSIITSLIHFRTNAEITQHGESEGGSIKKYEYSTGCTFDYCKRKEDKISIVNSGIICHKHKEEILKIVQKSYGEKQSQRFIADFEKLINLNWIGTKKDINSPAYVLWNLYKFDIEEDYYSKTTPGILADKPAIIPGVTTQLVGRTFSGCVIPFITFILGLFIGLLPIRKWLYNLIQLLWGGN